MLQALKREQERTMEELKDLQGNELSKTLEKLDKDCKEEEDKKLREFESYRSRAINEARNRQSAELSSRNNMSVDESKRVSLHPLHVLNFINLSVDM